ncbi:molybdopterin-dependent oxidoreductase [bacterium]|nr:molybdopterin-dependent oxidoreductase [bacterium]
MSVTFLREHLRFTRRYFMQMGVAGLSAISFSPPSTKAEESSRELPKKMELGDGIKKSKSLITSQAQFYDVSRGQPIPHTLPDDKKREVGMTRDTWKLEVIADPEHRAVVRQPMSKEQGTSFDFDKLMNLAEKRAVRFGKVMTCLNLGCPLGYGIWEGVPLRDVIWLTNPGDDVRRVFYFGYHNDDPKQIFRSSLPMSRVLEDPFDLPPIILCYKLNGEWLTPERGGPVRIVVPEAYGFKSVKWLTHVVLTNLFHANDTYAEQGNDIDSPLKTFAATINAPQDVKAGEKIVVSGYAQVGINGLSKVQAWIQNADEQPMEGDRYYERAPWVDMEILGPPDDWGSELKEGKIPLLTHGFDSSSGKPLSWPMRLGMIHWAGVFPPLARGSYIFRCRAIDEKGGAQPMPRPFRRSGFAAIEQVSFKVT